MDALILIVLVIGILVAANVWLTDKSSNSVPPKKSPAASTTASTANEDPNWEDHIRHDPNHPAGSPGNFTSQHFEDYDNHDR